MSHLQPSHKSFARYASVLRENLIACDASLRKGEEDWQATLGRLNAAFVRYFLYAVLTMIPLNAGLGNFILLCSAK
jgi:hypothetical protein